MRILVFGDSITQGYWDTEGGWVDRVRSHYDSMQIQDLENNKFPTIFNLGISADNSKNVINRIESETIARTRHGNLPVVIVQIGINDSVESGNIDKNRNMGLPISEYEQNLQTIVNKLQTLCSKIIFVGLSACEEKKTTPVFWGDFYYRNDSIKTYENVIKEVAEKNNISFIPIFDEFLEKINNGKEYLPDGLHPNNEGHEFISKLVINKLKEILL